jgi:large subunit ribosomal protein L9
MAVDMTFEMQASPEGKLFGSVTNADIAARLAAGGVEVERRKIVIAEPIKTIGEHPVTVRLHREVPTPILVKVVASGALAEETEAEPEGMETEERREFGDER